MGEASKKKRDKENMTEKPIEKPAEATLIDRVTGVIEDVMKAKLATFEKKIDDKIESILKAKEIEIEQALRKSFGTETDPVIHSSDMIAFFRKAQLEASDASKKTPAAIEKAGPEGTKPSNPIDKMYNDFGGKA
jgi:hypothetical protein